MAHGEPEPIKYWLSNLSASTAKRTLVRQAKLRWRIEHDYRGQTPATTFPCSSRTRYR